MTGWARRIRGAIGMGVAWAATWAPIGALFGLGIGLAFSAPVPLGTIVVANATTFGLLGFVGGGIFSGFLRLSEGRKGFDELSMGRFVALGAAGGLLLGGLAVFAGFWGPGLQLADVVITLGATVLGAGSAGTTLAIARQAGEPALPAGAEEHRRLA